MHFVLTSLNISLEEKMTLYLYTMFIQLHSSVHPGAFTVLLFQLQSFCV